ncbi:retrovirus-related pol polyprotein from transposon TNT 1-94 [Tanacetum coccineum]
MIRAATCHHLSGTRWRDTVPALSPEPKNHRSPATGCPTVGQTVAVNRDDQRWRTTVNHRRTIGQRWLTASQQAGYSLNSKAYAILNKYTRKIKESLNVTIDETPPPFKTSTLVDDDLDEDQAIKVSEKKALENDTEDETLEVMKLSQAQNQSNFFCFISTTEPKNVNQALKDESWIIAMYEELNQFIANDVWELVPQPKNMTIIGTKWVYKNKLDENGVVSQNKARILLSYACALDIKLFQMDIKSAFLNGFINEKVYVAQPPGFIDFEKPDHVYKLKKALYGLKQAPKICIDVIDKILEEDFNAILDEGSKILYSIEGTLLKDQIFTEFEKFMAVTIKENYESNSDKEEIPFQKITFDTHYKIKKSLDEPSTNLELKPIVLKSAP